MAPTTLKAPEVEINNEPDIFNAAGILIFAEPPMVVPPFPVKVTAPVPEKTIFCANQLIAEVAVIVLGAEPEGPIVTLGTLNVPAV